MYLVHCILGVVTASKQCSFPADLDEPSTSHAIKFLSMQRHAINVVQASMTWLQPRTVHNTLIVVPSNMEQLDLALNWRVWAAAHSGVAEHVVYQCLDTGSRDFLAKRGEPCLFTDYTINTAGWSANPFGKDWAQPIIARLQRMHDDNIARINSREESTNFGQIEIC